MNQIKMVREKLSLLHTLSVNATTTAEKRDYRSKYHEYRNVLVDLQIQLEALYPELASTNYLNTIIRNPQVTGTDKIDPIHAKNESDHKMASKDVESVIIHEIDDDDLHLDDEDLIFINMMLTKNQFEYIDLYYNQGMTIKQISVLYGVSRSTISHVITEGMRKVQFYTQERMLIKRCTDKDGSLDIYRLITESNIITDKQREILIMRMEENYSVREIAEIKGLNPSSIIRSIQQAIMKFLQLGIPYIKLYPLVRARNG